MQLDHQDSLGLVLFRWLAFGAAFGLIIFTFGCGGTGVSPEAREFFQISGASNPFAPRIVLNGSNPLILEAGDEFQDPGARAIDVDGNVLTDLISVEIDPNLGAELGNSFVVYRVFDRDGREGLAIREIRVVDTKAPSLSLLGDTVIRLERLTEFLEPGFQASDGFDGDLSNAFDRLVVEGRVDIRTVGRYVLKYQISDSAGNLSETSTREVLVIDTRAPRLRLVEPAEGLAINQTNQNAIRVSGECDEDERSVTISVADRVLAQIACAEGRFEKAAVSFAEVSDGPVTLTATLADQVQNQATATVNLVKDSSAPAVTITAPLANFEVNRFFSTQLEVNGSCSENGRAVQIRIFSTSIQATPNCSGGQYSATLNLTGLGNGSIRVDASTTDSLGNLSALVSVSGSLVNRPPSIVLTGGGLIVLSLCTPFVDAGAFVDFNADGSPDAAVTSVSGAVDHLIAGDYVRTYTFTASSGQSVSAQRTIRIAQKMVNSFSYEYGLASASDFQKLRDHRSDNHLMCNSIDMTGINHDPIASSGNPFNGRLEGQNFEIQNLMIDRESSNRVGFFEVIGPDASITNLTLIVKRISGREFVGSLAGINRGFIKRVFVKRPSDASENEGLVEGDKFVGGLVGEQSNLMREVSSEVNVTGSDKEIGGLCGVILADSGVFNSSAKGTVTGGDQADAVGGLVGLNQGTILTSFASGAVSGHEQIGGLVGESQSELVSQSFWNSDTALEDDSNPTANRVGLGRSLADLKKPATYIDALWSTQFWTFTDGQLPSLK